MSVCKMFTFKNDSEFDEFEISGSTYEPVGDVFHDGKKIKGSDFLGLEEMAVISVMCNDSAIDFNEYKNAFEKVSNHSTLRWFWIWLEILSTQPLHGIKHDLEV